MRQVQVQMKDLQTDKVTMIGPKKESACYLQELNKALCDKFFNTNRAGLTHMMISTVNV